MRNVDSPFDFFEFDGKPSTDFGAMIFSHGQYSDPEPNESDVQIPGMNGVLHFWDGSFKEVTVSYSVIIKNEDPMAVREKINRMRAWLLSKRKYCRLQDTLYPDYYRMAIYKGKTKIKYSGNEQIVGCEIEFQCKPQMFLKSGDVPINMTNDSILYNSTDFIAMPLIRVYGSGSILVNGTTVSITDVSGYADIDCELQEVEGYNDKTTLQDGEFPVLVPGESKIRYTGFSRVEIFPRWWTL